MRLQHAVGWIALWWVAACASAGSDPGAGLLPDEGETADLQGSPIAIAVPPTTPEDSVADQEALELCQPWRVEPALEALDRFLDTAVLSSPHEIRVVHGFGTGRLRKAVREFLRSHPVVASFRPGRSGEGGDGATVGTLKES